MPMKKTKYCLQTQKLLQNLGLPAKSARYDDEFDDIAEDENQTSEVQAYQMKRVVTSEDKDVLGF